MVHFNALNQTCSIKTDTQNELSSYCIFFSVMVFVVLIGIATDNPSRYTSDYISAINIEHRRLEIWFSPFLRYSLPATINAYYNAILRTMTNGNKYSIEGTSHLAPTRIDQSSVSFYFYLFFSSVRG